MKKPDFRKIPALPGVYQFLNAKREIVYIGKAKNLRSRVSSYWHKGGELSPAKQQMVSEVADIDCIVVSNETEALLLEAGLIKKHLPPYNIVLRDDKNWTYIVITAEAFPKIVTVHGRKKIRGEHFGPYTSAKSARAIVRLIHQILPLRTCARDLSKLPNGRVCMQYHLGRCLGPCEKLISAPTYDDLIVQARAILKGQTKEILKSLNNGMATASREQHYEKAALLRDKIRAFEKIFQPQRVVNPLFTNRDVVYAMSAETIAVVTVLQLRGGQLWDKFNYRIDNPLRLTAVEVLDEFLLQYYAPPNQKPKEVIVSTEISVPTQKALSPAAILVPQRGTKRTLIEIARKNAELFYEKITDTKVAPKVLYELKDIFELDRLPIRIECYDISNIGPQYAVGAMAVMHEGKLKPSEYRKFKIKTVRGQNDVMMMREVLERRQKHDEWPEPQLIVLDGGKPQLSAVYPILKPEWKSRLAALAKREEELFVPGRAKSIRLPKSNPASLLLQKLRNATHRQAIMYYRLLHRKGYKKVG